MKLVVTTLPPLPEKQPPKLEPSQEELLFDLINAFALVKTPINASLLLQDLLTRSEIRNLSRRLRIAKLLLEGQTQPEIVDDLHCSFGTVSKVKQWLDNSGKGLRKVIKKLPKRKERLRPVKGYYGYGWPQLALVAILNTLEKRERKRLETTFENIKDKNALYHKIQEVLNEEFIGQKKEQELKNARQRLSKIPIKAQPQP